MLGVSGTYLNGVLQGGEGFVGGSQLVGDGTNILAVKNGTAAQILRVYNTSPTEWLEFTWQATANTAVIRTATTGGTARVLQLRYGNTTQRAMDIPIAITSPIEIGNVTPTTNASGLVRVGGTANSTSTSGSLINLNITAGAAPTATSTLALIGLNIAQTINYSNATPGAGTWRAINIAMTETANPTGAKHMIYAAGGVAGATPVFSVDNAGQLQYYFGNTTGAGTALLGTNSPAVTVSAPYTWLTMLSADGSTVYVPAWK